MEQQLALLILGDLDPYPPTITRRASPPPEIRRTALAVLRLTRRYSSDRVEAAAGIALASVHSPRYAHLRPILESRQDQHGHATTPSPADAGGYVRGGDYYAGGAR